MVPEWEEYFDLKALDEFVTAAKTHDIAKAGKAAGALGKTCGKCHSEQSLSVWTKFHWPSFHKIKVTDPIDEKEMPFDDYMGKLSGSFKGVTVNFGEGQYNRTKKALRTFKTRFMELKSTCSKCHINHDVKLFYVGNGVARAFDNLKAEISKSQPDPGKFWKNIGVIGKQGCKKCHLTHRAYSIIQGQWEEK
jgi:cytochrome c556